MSYSVRPAAALLVPLILGWLAGVAGAQSTWYVDDDGPGDPGPGNPFVSDPGESGSPLHPFDRLSEAIGAAASGDTILVLPSNPAPTGLHYFEIGTIDLGGAGGPKTLTIRSTDGPASTILEWVDAQPDAPMLRADSGESAAFLFEGFTLRGADNGSTSSTSDYGGALVVSGSSPTFRNCRFESGHAYRGGAAWISGSASLFEDCTFTGNDTVHQGGAIYTSTSSPTFSRCTFVGNTAGSNGGAVLGDTVGGNAIRVLDSAFLQNMAAAAGGGLGKFGAGTITVERSRFLANMAATNGGGMVLDGGGEVWDSTFNSNEAGAGGGLYISGTTGNNTATGSTFTNNLNGGVLEAAGIIFGFLRNCIVWDNTGFEIGINLSVTYCDVLGGYGGVGNLALDPLFVDPWGQDGVRGTLDDDLSLMRESPCIDAGQTLVLAQRSPHVPYPLDVEGHPRAVDSATTPDTGIAVLGTTVDLGAHEFRLTPRILRR